MKEKKEQLIFRNEWKHSMTQRDYITIRSRLAEIAESSMYAGLGGMYRVRSLAFVEPEEEKKMDLLLPLGRKENFRIRYYNENEEYIRLEKKTRIGGKSNKQSAVLTPRQCEDIIKGDLEWMKDSEEALLAEFYQRAAKGGLVMEPVADFEREAFVYRPCNVRITLDSRLRTGIDPLDFLNLEKQGTGAGSLSQDQEAEARKEAVLMEIKYDCFLPEVIRAAIRIKAKRATSFDRYEALHAGGQA